MFIGEVKLLKKDEIMIIKFAKYGENSNFKLIDYQNLYEVISGGNFVEIKKREKVLQKPGEERKVFIEGWKVEA